MRGNSHARFGGGPRGKGPSPGTSPRGLPCRRPGTSTNTCATSPGTCDTSCDPLPGKTHDAKAVRDLHLDHHFNESNAFADKGYVGCGVTTPFKKPADGELLEWHKEFNKVVNQYRYVIERAIANFKTWRCMHTDYRRPLRTYPTAFSAIRSLHFFKLSFR